MQEPPSFRLMSSGPNRTFDKRIEQGRDKLRKRPTTSTAARQNKAISMHRDVSSPSNFSATQPYGPGANSHKGNNSIGSRVLLRNTSAKNRILDVNRDN